METEDMTEGGPAISRFEVSEPKRMAAGSTAQLVADCTTADPKSRLVLSAVPSSYTLHPASVPLNPGTNLVRIRVVVAGPPGQVTIVGKLGSLSREDSLLVEGARSRPDGSP
jgi:hypothetical protein